MVKRFIFLIFLTPVILLSQISLEYQTNFFPYYSVAGWLPFKKSGNNWEYRFYYLDSTKFQIYSSHYNGNIQYTYNFTQPEITAGSYIYSLNIDLTGDGIVEFYVIGQYNNGTYPRQSVKILDITNNNSILELNLDNFYYSAPSLYDIDKDGLIEMIFVEYDMTSFWRYRLIVYNTNVPSTVIDQNDEMAFDLFQNFPNPFNPYTIIRFNVQRHGNVKLHIHNLNGELIKTLLDETLRPGKYEYIWDGTDSKNNKVSSGVYFYTLVSDKYEISKKMLMVK